MQKKCAPHARLDAAGTNQTLSLVGNWEWDFASGNVTWSDGLYRLLGLEPGLAAPSLDLFMSRVHPDEREAAYAAANAARTRGQTIDDEYRIILPSGDLRWLANKGEVFFDRDGNSSWAAGALFDVTEIREAQLALAAREERYRALASVNALCEWRGKPNGQVVESSFWGETSAGSSGRESNDWLEAVHPDDREFAREIWAEALRVGSSIAFSYRMLHPTGAYRWVMCRAVPLNNPDGSVREWVGSTEDIQESREAERRLRLHESRLRLALDAGRISTWDYELSTGVISQSDNALDVLGFRCRSLEELRDRVHPDDWEKVLAALRATEETGVGLEIVFRVPQNDENVRWVKTRAKLLRSVRQEPARMIGISWDVTAAKLAESAQRETLNVLSRLTSRIEALSSIANDFLWSAAPDGRIIDADGWCDFTGQSPREVSGWGWLNAIHPADRERTREGLQQLIDEDLAQAEYRLRDRTGTYQWVRSRAAPLVGSDGNVEEWVGVCQVLRANRYADENPAGESQSCPELKLISGSQVRAARGLLRWSVNELAEASGVSRSSIRRIEEEDGIPEARDVRSLQKIRAALEDAGLSIQESSNGCGLVGRMTHRASIS